MRSISLMILLNMTLIVTMKKQDKALGARLPFQSKINN